MTDDLRPDESRLAELAAAYDEALRAGTVETDRGAPLETDVGECLMRLSRLWPAAAATSSGSESSPRSFGRFELQEPLGTGGFGVVYRSFDPVLNRDVALKLPRVAALFDPDARERFLREGQAAAGLYHPHIVPILEAGEAEGVCYLVMALCRGTTLAARLKEGAFDPGTAVRVLLPLADAVEHAHLQGVLHRDIKPQNVLLDPARPGDALPFTPKLTDFGLAKLFLADGAGTQTGHLLGTPQYMAPEQASGRNDAIGPATDVYALGAVLYELVTGRPPIVGNDPTDTLRRLATEEPVRVRRLAPHVARDLEAIIHKCLEKSLTRRYATAAGLADDLRRHLAGAVTVARPVACWERLRRLAVRHPAGAALIGTIIAASVALMALMGLHNSRLAAMNEELGTLNVSLQGAVRAKENARNQALRSEALVREQLYISDISLAERAWSRHNTAEAARLLDRHVPGAGEADLRGFEWYVLRKRCWGTHRTLFHFPGEARCACYAPLARTVAAGATDGTIALIDVGSSAPPVLWRAGTASVNSLSFSGDGTRLACAGDDGRVRLFDVASGRELLSMAAHSGAALQVLFSPDGARLVSCGMDRNIQVWDAQTGTGIATLPSRADFVRGIALSPDGRLIASTSNGGPARVHDLETGEEVSVLQVPRHVMTCIAFSPNGRFVATGAQDRRVRVFDANSGQALAMEPQVECPSCLAFLPNSNDLIVGDEAGMLRVWRWEKHMGPSTERRTSRSRFVTHRGAVGSLAVSADGAQVLSAGDDGRIVVTEVSNEPIRDSLQDPHPIWDMATVAGSSLLATAGGAGIRLHDLTDERVVHAVTDESDPAFRVAVSPHGTWMAAAGNDRLTLWHARDHVPLDSPIHLAGMDRNITRLVFSPDETQLAVTRTGPDGDVRLYEVPSLRLVRQFPAGECHTCAFSPDGSYLLYVHYVHNGAVPLEQHVLLADVATWRTTPLHYSHSAHIVALAVDPDSKWIASGGYDRVFIANIEDAEKVWHLPRAQSAEASSVAFSPDGRTLATGSSTGLVQLWHVASGRPLCSISTGEVPVEKVEFSSDGRCLPCLLRDGKVLVIDTTYPEAE